MIDRGLTALITEDRKQRYVKKTKQSHVKEQNSHRANADASRRHAWSLPKKVLDFEPRFIDDLVLQMQNLPYNNAFARIPFRYLGNFQIFDSSSGRPSHESNYYSILYFLIADPQPRGRAAKALLSNPID